MVISILIHTNKNILQVAMLKRENMDKIAMTVVWSRLFPLRDPNI
jgi:hypothetical protein